MVFIVNDLTNKTEADLVPFPVEKYRNKIGERYLPNVIGILVTEEEKAQCLDALAKQITADYRQILRPDEAVVVAPLLNGAMNFGHDLSKKLDFPIEIDALKLDGYFGGISTTGEIRMHKDFSRSVKGRHVLLVEDIVDTGNTLEFILGICNSKKVASVKMASFLDKPMARKVDVYADYVGFRIPDMFVIGYGLDINNQCRHLDEVAVYSEKK
jgi:hypoxanthine phosphoribosyltransferase